VQTKCTENIRWKWIIIILKKKKEIAKIWKSTHNPSYSGNALRPRTEDRDKSITSELH